MSTITRKSGRTPKASSKARLLADPALDATVPTAKQLRKRKSRAVPVGENSPVQGVALGVVVDPNERAEGAGETTTQQNLDGDAGAVLPVDDEEQAVLRDEDDDPTLLERVTPVPPVVDEADNMSAYDVVLVDPPKGPDQGRGDNGKVEKRKRADKDSAKNSRKRKQPPPPPLPSDEESEEEDDLLDLEEGGTWRREYVADEWPEDYSSEVVVLEDVHAVSAELLASCAHLAIFASVQPGEGRAALAGNIFVLLSRRRPEDPVGLIPAGFFQVSPLPADCEGPRRASLIATSNRHPDLEHAGLTGHPSQSLMTAAEVISLDFEPSTVLHFVSARGWHQAESMKGKLLRFAPTFMLPVVHFVPLLTVSASDMTDFSPAVFCEESPGGE